MNSKQKLNIGIDFGGVLSVHDKKDDKKDIDGQNIIEHKNTSINMPHAIETLLRLKEDGNKLYLISFCGKKRAIETHDAIINSEIKDIFEREFYVKNIEYKKYICQLVNCDIMIDDTCEILDSVKSFCPNITTILFNNEDKDRNWNGIYNFITNFEKKQNTELLDNKQKIIKQLDSMIYHV
jgi:hypothetical protein